MNIVIKEFNNFVLHAAKECFPKGERKDYTSYWNEYINNKHNELTTARTLADVAPSIENTTSLKQTDAKFIKTRNDAKRISWMKKTASLNMDTDSNKLWRLTKQLNDEENRHAKITLLQDRKMVHGKQAGNIFADTNKEASNIPVELHKHNYLRTEQRKITESDYVSTAMNSPLSYEELTSALSNLKLKKSPGPDAITNEMIVNLGQPALHKLLDIFSKTLQDGTLPQIWIEATMIPIHKKGKANTEVSSYRPISLTSCIVRVLERIINTRLKWFLQSEKLLASEQAGFREHHCTEDQTTYLAHEIEDGFQHKKQTLTVWIELQKAFDTVWTDGLLLKLKKCNIAGNVFRWVKSYLHNLRARVVIDNTTSKKILFRQGVPQGGVISPTLFLVFINDLIKKFPSPVKCAMYADDLVLWNTEEYATTAKI